MALVSTQPAPLSPWDHPIYKIGDLKLESNVGEISSSMLRWLVPLPATASDDEIRREYETKGVVHIKGVIPRETVLAMRAKYFEFMDACGVLKEGTSSVEGIFHGNNPRAYTGPGNASGVGNTPESCEYLRLGIEAHKQQWADDFANDENLARMVGRIKPEWKTRVLFKRQLLRSNIPNSEGTATQVHYDQIFLRAAPPTSLTAWVPIGDCGPLSGGLLYLEDSVPVATEIEEGFTKMSTDKGLSDAERMSAFNVNMGHRGMLAADAGAFAQNEGGGRNWLVGDYEAGDVVFHHPLMIHASSVNRDPNGVIRLATDLRFANADAPYDERWCRGFFVPGDGL